MNSPLRANAKFVTSSGNPVKSFAIALCVLAASAALSHAGGIRGCATKNGKALSNTQVAIVVGGQTTYVMTNASGFYRCEIARTLAGQTAVAYVTSKKSHKATIAVPASGYNTLNLSFHD